MEDKKVVLITGASSGFGKKAAIKFLKQGYIVYATARSVGKMDDLKEKGAHVLFLDVTNESKIKSTVKEIINQVGRIDVLLNNAGFGGFAVFEGVNDQKAREQFDVNVFGAAAVMREVLPFMRKRRSGIIINMSSVAGRMTVPFGSWYSASKHALEAISDSVRMEVKPFNIKVYTIEPGMMDTGFFDVAKREMENSKIPSDYNEAFANFTKHLMFYYKLAPSAKGTVSRITSCAKGYSKKARHPVGLDSKLGVMSSSILSDRLNDFLYMKLFGVKY